MSGLVWQRLAVTSRVLAAVLGAGVLALATAVALALAVPEPRRLGVALGVSLAVPLWVAAMIPGFLARRAWRAWLGYLGGALAGAGVAWLLRR